MRTFRNTPNVDFSLPARRAAMNEALDNLNKTIEHEKLRSVPFFDGNNHECTDVVYREDPSCHSVKLGEVHYADVEQVECALSSLTTAWPSWRQVPTADRILLTRKLAYLLEEGRSYFSALIIRESGKPWKEADAEVSEAIDFCLYYSELMEELAEGCTNNLPGQENYFNYWPKGRVAIIAPWNFPLAILCGMTVAALVTGNQAVIKPAEQSSLIGYAFAKTLIAAGFPCGSFAFLPGRGELVGKSLVEALTIDMICFTGSKEVGLQIVESAAVNRSKQRSIKKVVAEMGGKNCIVVDSDADLDAALGAILYSAFGYAGQKCSACSRVLVVGDNYDRICERLKEAAKDITVGASANSETIVGPVIDEATRNSVLDRILHYESNLSLLFKGETPANGYFVPITIFRDVPSTSSLWTEELFAPVLAVSHCQSFYEAIVQASDSNMALTGSVFSRHPNHIEHAKTHFEVGNLYINQGTTGSLVARQPFGGFKLSGCGSKAGGKNYLLQFLNERTVTENTIRKGYTPELA
jgi:RHH-type transcriptional regulator, proline utilization regulon repressor / proline dehydrogenase / delta 1-pyrroline-5-carboxylate dehydrogenase